eukprot:TRINITY_DN506_c2_g1_i2.p1 TRINITY_DN506_c2_g1~~TRINITY_DN506_c2_g1_i2.p1  ORF type:complete len:347 (-),score=-3.53 TRINITY_DN506_c2_g1_i2:28-1068(-)
MTKKPTSPKPVSEPIVDSAVSNNPLVFISHDTRDAELAEAFSQLLSNSSMGILESFRSSDKRGTQGIEYGTLWYEEILKKLNEASDVVCLLTNHSIDRPWILYEAGIAIGKSNTPLIGIALGIPLNKANNGPFAQFQNCADDIDSLTKLICSLVKKIPNAKPIEEVVKGQVQQFINKIRPILEGQPLSGEDDSKITQPAVEDTQVAKLFEEIKIMFQDLPSRIDKNSSNDIGRRSRRFQPQMIEEMVHFTKDPSVGFLMILSFFRNDLPWLYELGIELSRNLKANKTLKDKEALVHDFERILDISIHNPYFEETLMRNKDEYRLYREMPHLLLKALHRMLDGKFKD